MNYGSGRLVVESTLVGNVRVDGAYAAPAVAPRIRFRLALTLTPHHDGATRSPTVVDYRLTGLGGELSLTEHGKSIGVLTQLGDPRHLRSLTYVDEQYADLTLDLDWYRLECLEEHRDGGPLVLWMKLWPHLEAASGSLPGRIEGFALRVPREDWLDILSTIRPDRIDLLEVRYRLVHAAHFTTSLSELAGARQAIDRGEMLSALIATRKAVSIAESALGAGGARSLEEILSSRIDAEHAKSYAGIASRLKALGNIQAHVSPSPAVSRLEALFAVRTAESLLELLSGLLGQTSGVAKPGDTPS